MEYKRSTKFLTVFLIVSIIFSGTFILQAPQAQATGILTFDTANLVQWIKKEIKEFTDDLGKKFAKAAMHVIAKYIRKQVLQGGPNGPSFVTNWRNYSRKNQDKGTDIALKLLGEVAYGVAGDPLRATLCEHLRDPIATAYKAKPVDEKFSADSRAYRTDSAVTFSIQTKCTLPTGFNFDNYYNNFEGGWDSFAKLLEPQNLSIGVAQITTNEITKQKQREEHFALNMALSGGGFLSQTNKNGQIKTPGQLLSNVAAQGVDSALRCLETVNTMIEFGECMAKIVPYFLSSIGPLANYRQIAEDLGLLEDEEIGTDEGDIDIPPAEVSAEQCNQICTDAAESQCSALFSSEQQDPPLPNFAERYRECTREEFDNCLAQNNFCAPQ